MSEEFLRKEGVPEGTPSPAFSATSPVDPVDAADDDEEGTPGNWDSFLGRMSPPRGVTPKSKMRRLRLAEEMPPEVSPQRRLLLLDTWRRSGLPAGDFAVLVGMSKHTLYA